MSVRPSVKASVSVTAQQAAFARGLVEEGRYPSLSAVVQRGLELLRAETEAREEAGVKGIVEHDPLGCFGYAKTMQEGLVLPCEVQVHALEVTGFVKDYKEKGERRLEWVDPAEAANRVAEPGLKKIILSFAKRES